MVFLPGSALERVVCCFDHQKEAFAIAGNDGRVKVFDTGTGSVRVEFGTQANDSSSLVEQTSCICWGRQALGNAHRSSQAAGLVVAAGTSSGDVKCFDLATGKASWHATAVVDGAVNGLAYDESTKRFLAAGSDGSVAAICAKSGKQIMRQNITSSALSAAHALASGPRALVAGSYLHLLNSQDLAVMCKMSGHSAAVRALAATPDGAYALSAAGGDRSIAIFSLAAKASTKPKVRKAKGHVAVPDPPVALSCCASDESPESCVDEFHALAVTEAGEVFVWRCRREDGAVSGALRARVCIGSADAARRGTPSGAQQCILDAAFEGANAITVVRGITAKPDFQLVQIPTGENHTICLPEKAAGLLLNESTSAASAKAKQHKPVAVGAENLGEAVLRKEAGGTKKARSRDSGKLVDDAFSAPVPNEPSLGERVAALNGADAWNEPPQTSGSQPTTSSGPVTADSLSVVLAQALRADDKSLLEKVLSTGNPSIIRNTVARLAPPDAALFLKAAVDRLQSKPARAGMLVPWLRATILCHTSYLSAAPGVQAHLTAMYQLIEARLAVFQPMLALRGRLDVVLAQRSQEEEDGANAQSAPLVVVDLGEQEVEAEDPYAVGNESDGEDEDMDEGAWEDVEGEEDEHDDDDGEDDDSGSDDD